jgi:hypothetical protein
VAVDQPGEDVRVDDIARVEIDALLGAPFLLADRIEALESTPFDKNDPL